jgi:G3E family GTPase
MLGRVMEGFPIGVHEPAANYDVVSVLFEARRPFHPQRLHDALQALTGEALRGRGQLWIASQPDAVVGWESAGGGIGLGSLGYWLAALPEDRWDEATACLLTDAEVAEGFDAWARSSDPFAGCFPLTNDTAATTTEEK